MTDRPDIHERTRRTLSREFDEPGTSSKDSVKRAQAHLGRCPQCRAFESALGEGKASGAALPKERASEQLVARILAAVQAERAAETTTASDSTSAVSTPAGADEAPMGAEGHGTGRPAATSAPSRATPAAHRAARGRRTPPWFPRLAVGVTAAAAIVALFLGARLIADRGPIMWLASGHGVTGGASAGTAESSAGSDRRLSVQGSAHSATGSAKSLSRSTPSAIPPRNAKPTTEPMTAPLPAVVTPDLGPTAPAGFAAAAAQLVGQPILLTFGSAQPYRSVWRFSGWLRNTPSNILIKVGTVNARLGAGGRPVPRTVYERLGDSSQKFVWWADDDYQVYRPETMRLQGRRAVYVLVSAGAIPDWGFWPTWPRSVAPYPSPGAVPGKETANAAGVAVYRAGAEPVSAGFAVSPDSKADPIARIPKWTWYSSNAPSR